MNWTPFIDGIMAAAATDEAKAFWLGIGLACGVRIVRAGMKWMKRATED